MSDYVDVKCRIKLKRRIVDNMLKGKVELIASDVIVIKNAYIEITGFASCSWNLDAVYIMFPKVYPEDTVVKGFQQFYYTRHALCGGEIAHEHKPNEAYKFKCYWPSRLPGTWFGDFGNIEYIAKVTIKLDNELDVYTHSQLIYVKFRRHLATEKHLLFEGRVDVSRNFFTTKSIGNVIVSVWLPISGIAAGQSLPVICSVTNHSKLHFGSLIFVLTRIDIYRSDTPISLVKTVRTDVCRVARMVNIHKGKYDFYSVLQTDTGTIPTNQFYKCTCCQVIYEVWVSVQGAFRRYRSFGYPNIDTPGIPVIIGTKPLRNFNTYEITAEIFKKMYETHLPVLFDELPEDVRQIIHTTDEELSRDAIQNLERQLHVNEQLISSIKQSSSQKLKILNEQ
ncbi:uncharacterized protein LOC103312401 [Tribolium castaneum]|uniref:uncharacterized protein LOC103312401 n=1 Tax=Tribolium castaneum TaxID=7070 RepID=UPI00077DE8EF|nr:PREDICTED: uncharacterized protein LOC103312401 [Tribolium castaneum]|eukprot:XP_008191157.2 PREDICTED: uncharacterized protein LOC103312401 [Tribolium castaneum]